MDKKTLYNALYKNRFLIINCLMLVFGTMFGTSMLKVMPEELSTNLFEFIEKPSTDFLNLFTDKFTFPFLTLFGIYLSGTGILGKFTAPFLIFITGFFFGFENAINYKFSGLDYIVDSLIIFFLSTIFIDFLLIIMSENSVFSSLALSETISQNTPEKPHYNAKKITVKFVAFTVIFVIICLIYSAFYKFIQPIL